MNDSVIVTAAITGSVHTPSMSPYLPITPQQIADEAVRAHEAGAAVVHIHVRNPHNGEPTYELDLYKEVITEIKSRCDAIICPTTGGFSPLTSVRGEVVTEFEPELASLNAGSMNFALFPAAERIREWRYDWEQDYLLGTEDLVFANTFLRLREFCEIFNEHNTVPEIEVYDLGMISNVAYLSNQGWLPKPVNLQFVLGIMGGAAASVENLQFLVRRAGDLLDRLNWSVCAAGKLEMPVCTAGLLLGGNVRVGLEDALWVERGQMARSNAELVEKIVRIAHEIGREPATTDEARALLGLKGLANVRY